MTYTLYEIAKAAVAHGLDGEAVDATLNDSPIYGERERLRDEFAKAAMSQYQSFQSIDGQAEACYRLADAMLKARAV